MSSQPFSPLLKITSLALALLVASPGAKALTLVQDDFSGNSGSVPSGWSYIGMDSSPANPILESLGTVSITDAASNGPQLIQSSAFSTYTELTLSVGISSFVGSNGSHPISYAALGNLSNYALVIQVDGLSKTMGAFLVYQGGVVGRYSFLGSPQLPSYDGTSLNYTVNFDSTGFEVTSSMDSYDSGHILYTAANVSGFDSISDFGASTNLILGTDIGSGVPTGTLGTVSYDSVSLTTTAVPEPNTAILLSGALAGMIALIRRKRNS